MPLVNNTNVSALQAQRTLGNHTSAVQRSMERLASGFRINRSADDAAGLAISNNMVGQKERMQQALRNAQDGVSMLQVAEGAISTIGDILQRVRELTVQAANDTNSVESRDAIEQEIRALLTDADRIANSTDFNGISLLNNLDLIDTSAFPPTVIVTPRPSPIQIGPNSTAQTNVMDIGAALSDVRMSTAPQFDPVSGTWIDVGGLDLFDDPANYVGPPGGPIYNTTFANIAAIDFPDNATAQSFLTDIDRAINQVISQRSTMGSFQNQLESVINNLQIGIENFGASVSRIRDLDVAEESSQLVQSQILQQSAVQVLAQSNRLPQMILGLLER